MASSNHREVVRSSLPCKGAQVALPAVQTGWG